LTLINEILSDLPSSEFNLSLSLDDGFYGRITNEGFNKLINNPKIKSIYRSGNAQIALQQSLPLINATKVWNLNYTGKGQTICVIDTGINYSHPDLGGCFGNGCKVLGGYDFYNTDTNPMDDNGHGTHVAGIIAAKGKINGTAPDANLIALKVCNSNGTNCPNGYIRQAIEWCISHKELYNISVISMSIGDNNSYTKVNCLEDLKTQINNAYFDNISVVIASGNNGFINGISWPACIGNATSVGAFGYKYELGVGEGGASICIFPDESNCTAWNFYRGKCGQNWSYCAKRGYGLKNLTNDEGWGEGAICINKTTKEEVGNVFNLVNAEFTLQDSVNA
jgi:subtilisin family serine protease